MEYTLVYNPQMMFFPPSALHLLTPASHSTFVCIALQHYSLRLPSGASEQALIANGPKIWQYRGEAIRELSRRVADKKTAYGLATIISIITFMANEVSTERYTYGVNSPLINNLSSKHNRYPIGGRMSMCS
jgi:hypothetical protein